MFILFKSPKVFVKFSLLQMFISMNILLSNTTFFIKSIKFDIFSGEPGNRIFCDHTKHLFDFTSLKNMIVTQTSW